MPETVPQTAAGLKAYFQTGLIPTAEQFAEFIDTMYYLYTEIVDAANAAAASAAAAQLAAQDTPIVSCYINWPGGAGTQTLQGVSKNVASIAFSSTIGAYNSVQINFTNAMANTYYRTMPQRIGTLVGPGTATSPSFYVVQQTLNYVIVATGDITRDLAVVIFP
jgi:hypothetical protein